MTCCFKSPFNIFTLISTLAIYYWQKWSRENFCSALAAVSICNWRFRINCIGLTLLPLPTSLVKLASFHQLQPSSISLSSGWVSSCSHLLQKPINTDLWVQRCRLLDVRLLWWSLLWWMILLAGWLEATWFSTCVTSGFVGGVGIPPLEAPEIM